MACKRFHVKNMFLSPRFPFHLRSPLFLKSLGDLVFGAILYTNTSKNQDLPGLSDVYSRSYFLPYSSTSLFTSSVTSLRPCLVTYYFSRLLSYQTYLLHKLIWLTCIFTLLLCSLLSCPSVDLTYFFTPTCPYNNTYTRNNMRSPRPPSFLG